MECGVCCGTTTEKMIPCGECHYQACRVCVQTYLVHSTRDPHCMNCRQPWDILHLRKNLGKEFLEGAFQEHRKGVLAKRRNRCQDRDVLCLCPVCPYGKIMKSTQTCLSCWSRVCPRCHLLDTPHHQCHEDHVRSLETITQMTRACPGCHVPIEKQSGCFQMFCTHCYTAFDWKNGQVLEKDTLHNPHYFDHQNKDTAFDPIHQTIHNMTDYTLKWMCREFYMLVRDIGQKAQHPPPQDIWQQQLCQHLIWVKYYKRGATILRNILAQPPPSSVQSQIQCFQKDLREILNEYNEYVAECVQLRGFRLFPCNPPLVCV